MQKVGSNYIAHELLGSGATGEVWRGTDSEGDPVAVKILRPEFSRKRDVVRRFIQERDLLTDIDHPHVVRVHDLVYDRSLLAIVMDLIEGGDLAALLFRAGPLPQKRVRQISAGVAMGLAAIHGADIVHLDLKPGNVLLAGEGEEETALIADLGVSQLARASSGVSEHPRFGTPQYTAPEIVTGDAVGSDADVYALGLLMVEMLQGRPAVDGVSDPMGVLEAQVTGEVERPPGADDELWQLIASMIDKDPEARPTALQVALALGVPREKLDVSAFHTSDTTGTGFEEGTDRPLFPVPVDPGRPRAEPSRGRVDSGQDGAPTTQLGHRVSYLRSAQTISLNETGPRTMALPGTDHAVDAGRTTEYDTVPGASVAAPSSFEELDAAPSAIRWRRGRRRLFLVASATLAAVVLIVGALIWLPIGEEDPPVATSTSPTSTPSPTETPTPSVPPDAIMVPDVTGMTEQAARQQIHGGLRVEVVSVEGTAADDGTVTGTEPEAGGPVSPGDTVTLQVARELASQPLTDLNPNATTGEATTSSVTIGGASYPGSLVLLGSEGLAESTIILQSRYMRLDTGLGVPDGGDPLNVQISLDQVVMFDETVAAGEAVPLSLDVTDSQQLSITATSSAGGPAELALTDPTLAGEKGRVPGS